MDWLTPETPEEYWDAPEENRQIIDGRKILFARLVVQLIEVAEDCETKVRKLLWPETENPTPESLRRTLEEWERIQNRARKWQEFAEEVLTTPWHFDSFRDTRSEYRPLKDRVARLVDGVIPSLEGEVRAWIAEVDNSDLVEHRDGDTEATRNSKIARNFRVFKQRERVLQKIAAETIRRRNLHIQQYRRWARQSGEFAKSVCRLEEARARAWDDALSDQVLELLDRPNPAGMGYQEPVRRNRQILKRIESLRFHLLYPFERAFPEVAREIDAQAEEERHRQWRTENPEEEVINLVDASSSDEEQADVPEIQAPVLDDEAGPVSDGAPPQGWVQRVTADEAPVAPPTRVQRGGWGILGVDAPAYPTTGWGSGTGWGTARAVKRDTEELETEERAKESAKRWRGNEPTGGDEFHQDTEPGSGLN